MVNWKYLCVAAVALVVLIFIIARFFFPGPDPLAGPGTAGPSGAEATPGGTSSDGPSHDTDNGAPPAPVTLLPASGGIPAERQNGAGSAFDPSAPGAVVFLLERLASLEAADRSREIQSLLDSGQASERASGMIAALEFELVNEGEIRQFAGEEDVLVSLSVLGWARDARIEESRAVLESALTEREDWGEDFLKTALRDRTVDAGAGRAALDLLQRGMEKEATTNLLTGLAEDSQIRPAIRFEAALRLAEVVEPTELPSFLRGLGDDGIPLSPPGGPTESESESFAPLLGVLRQKYAGPPPILESRGTGMSRGDARAAALYAGVSSFDLIASIAEQSLRTGRAIEPGVADLVEELMEESYHNPEGKLAAPGKRGERRLLRLLPEIREAEEQDQASGFSEDIPPGAEP